MVMRQKTRFKNVLIVLLLTTIFLYNEYFSYEISASKWKTKECTECVTVLLVADPQILGDHDENYWGAAWALWDSDRYLWKTFSRAIARVEPAVIAFLGDVMDEGHIASDEEFEKYKRRLASIFNTSDRILKIYVPGDNDIGGEEDMVSDRIHKRFNLAYLQPNILVHSSATFLKVVRLTQTIPSLPKDTFVNSSTKTNSTNVVISHLPLLFNPDTFVRKVLKELSPQIIFTAHDHKAMHRSLHVATDQLSKVWVLPPRDNQIYHFRLDTHVHELKIPTCSYRMGTLNMGFGLAYIDSHRKTLDFAVLWLPNRFYQLGLYAIVVLVAALSVIYRLCKTCLSTRGVAYSRVPVTE